MLRLYPMKSVIPKPIFCPLRGNNIPPQIKHLRMFASPRKKISFESGAKYGIPQWSVLKVE